MNPETQFQLVHIKLANGKEGVFIGPAIIMTDEEMKDQSKIETLAFCKPKHFGPLWVGLLQSFFKDGHGS